MPLHRKIDDERAFMSMSLGDRPAEYLHLHPSNIFGCLLLESTVTYTYSQGALIQRTRQITSRGLFWPSFRKTFQLDNVSPDQRLLLGAGPAFELILSCSSLTEAIVLFGVFE